MGSSSLCSISQIDEILDQKKRRQGIQMDESIKSVREILEFSKMVLKNLPSYIKIYSVLIAFLNPSCGLRDRESELSF